jgi:protein involved in polysaccharide export with SLBB domain
MRIFLLQFVLCFGAELLGQKLVQATSATLKEENGYRIRPGDKINISVLNEPDCNQRLMVPNDGIIRLTHVGEFKVINLSTKSLESLIKQEYILKEVFLRPVINVSISDYSKRFVYLNGSVNKKGPFALPPEVEAMNIVELISMSGGFTDIAKKTQVYVTRTYYRQDGSTEQKTFEVDVDSLSRGSTQNRNDKFWIYPEDQINVPERYF